MGFHFLSINVWLVLVSLLPLLLFLIKKPRNQEGKLPPSPPKLPILGNLHQLGELPHRSTWELSKKYGPVMLLQLGAVPTIIVFSAESAKEVLKTHDLECASRPPLAGSKRLTYNFLDIGFSPYGYYWREMRKICVLELFSTKRVQSFQSVREEEVAVLMNSISESAASEKPFDLTKGFFSLTASVTCRIAFGKTLHGSEIDISNIQKVVFRAQAMLGSFFATDFLPYLGWIIDWLSGLHERLETSFHELDVLFQHVIEDHLDPGRTAKDQEDIVDVLLRMERDQTEKSTIQLTKDHIKAILMDIFLAGIDTSAITMIWVMTELARKPIVMKKAQQEIRHCMGKKGKLTETDVHQFQYLKMIIKETFRLHPTLPLLLPRETQSQIKIGDYDVYPKARIGVNVWAIGRDPNIWNDPEEFYPERFMDSQIDFKGQNFELLPFGGGRRMCPGMNMGMATIELALANLLYFFDWKLPNGMKEMDIDMEEELSLTIGKKSALKLIPINHILEDHNT